MIGSPLTIKQKKEVKIAMAQILCIDGDRTGNFVRIENALIDASKQEVDIVVFPESAILGWQNPDAHQLADPIPGNDSRRLCELAKKYEVFICIGLDEKDGDQLYDSAILIDDTGHIILKHRKFNVLPELMTPPYSIGEDLNVVETKFGTIGMLICADSFMNNLLDSMKMKAPDLMLIPYGWAAPEKDWPEHGKELEKVVKNASKVIDCPVVGTDLIGRISKGPWTGLVYGGQSVAYDHRDDTTIIGKDRDRDIVVFTLEL
ncbi:carbon-nitrogen hydrolase family protein [Portibacter lacus]|uniref:Beta-alanine synthetase n=2 Tax=Portibacter lacus TaxID=1099794 RepID=A0AA37WDU6_9BACT|nr:carbon-nitrogen hydrolase family protein [Portibacter lacus]GLR16019.1 beta-alanine synthetase [Portibacter lacus]